MRKPRFNDPILERLCRRQGTFVSGASLASELGISRVAVWNTIQRFRKDGFTIEAVRNRGYRIKEEPVELHTTLLKEKLRGRGIEGLRLQILNRVSSTMDEALRLLERDARNPVAVLAREQTEGRGRLRRPWISTGGKNLYLTIGSRPHLPVGFLRRQTLRMAVIMAEWLNARFPIKVRIKWPNDLWTANGKLAGLLVEARMDGDEVSTLATGLGLNVNATPEDLSAIPIPATSLFRETGQKHSLNTVAADCIAALIPEQRPREGTDASGDNFADRWNRLDLLRGHPVTVKTLTGESRTGTANGIDDSGALVVKLTGGGYQTFHSGDAHLESMDPECLKTLFSSKRD